MTAFGPFINTEVIDFVALGDNPLFLINGTTGSGKTTILDAICFALYGQTTGKEREAMQMRCDFAPDDLLTEVEFIFELAGEFYQIKRVPEQLRTKSKGEGTTKQAASAELNRLDKDHQNTHNLVARKVLDATQEIENLTGLQVDQFRQVMVLPQGQFRQLLMADSEDREKIFSQLFETHIYKRIEDKLKAQASVISKKVQDLKENQNGILLNVGVENNEALDFKISELKPEVDVLKTELALKSAANLESVKAFEKSKELEQDFLNLKQQEESLDTLKLQENEIKEKKQQLKLAVIAEKITPIFNILSKTLESHDEVSKQLVSTKKSYQNALEVLKNAEEDLLKNPQRQTDLDAKQEQGINLKSYQEKGEILRKALDQQKLSHDKFKKGELQVNDTQILLNDLLQNLSLAEKEKVSLDDQLKQETTIKLNLQTLSEQIKKRQSYEEIEAKVSSLTKEIADITEIGKTLKSTLGEQEIHSKSLELKWHQAQAAILAEDLNDGQACLVCGSFEHPHPAIKTVDYPTIRPVSLRSIKVRIARSRESASRLPKPSSMNRVSR